jgi:hypothetical protein
MPLKYYTFLYHDFYGHYRAFCVISKGKITDCSHDVNSILKHGLLRVNLIFRGVENGLESWSSRGGDSKLH